MRLLSSVARPPLLVPARASPAMALGIDPAMALEGIDAAATSLNDVSTALAFADQGNNLAGIFFQASLLPYLGFLYFLGYEKNGCPKTAQFGAQFLLLFVISTVATGIVTKSTYGSSLADVDWLHGGAEALLTTSNLFLGFGLAGALSEGKMESPDTSMEATKWPRYAAGALAVAVFGSAFAGPSLGLQAHDAFLFGAGALPPEVLASFPLPLHAEPANALSVPTWAIHFSSVFEYLFAMGMVWQFATLSGNPKWRGLTWGMLPLHASGVAACTYHFFYNNPELSFLVALQAGLTLLGNTTVCIAALRIALSNGWTLSELNPFGNRDKADADATAPAAAVATTTAAAIKGADLAPNAAKLVVLTLLASYGMKYGELVLGGLPFEANVLAAALIVAAPPATVAWRFNKLSQE